jgi:hypothetical protein
MAHSQVVHGCAANFFAFPLGFLRIAEYINESKYK